jgi:hypothetical protein
VTKGTKESGKLRGEGSRLRTELEAEGSKLKDENPRRRACVFWERIFKSPAGRGSIWKRTSRRKRPRKIAGNVHFLPNMGSSRLSTPEGPRNAHCSVPRIMIRKIPSSIREKAQISMEPKAMGVKMRRRIIINLTIKSIMA